MAESRIGLFDSGIGGLTVLRSLKGVLPHESYIYLGDTARTPYGSKGRETIIRYSRECATFLRAREVDTIVVACNTASSHALSHLITECDVPVIGTVDAAVNRAIEGTGGVVGVIGTEATIASGAYERALHAVAPSLKVYSRPCPLFVPLVEQGMFSGSIVDKVVELYLEELRGLKIDTLILGCTHYPLLEGAINAFFCGAVRIVACSDAMADEICRRRQNASPGAQRGAEDQFFVTDDPERFNRLGGLFLGNGVLTAQQVELS